MKPTPASTSICSKSWLKRDTLDSKPIIKESVECKRYSNVEKILKEFVGVIIITKSILNLGVKLILGKLLIFKQTMEK